MTRWLFDHGWHPYLATVGLCLAATAAAIVRSLRDERRDGARL